MVLFHLLRCHRYLWRGLRDRAHVSRILRGAAPLPADVPTAVVPVRTMRHVADVIAAASQTPAGGAAGSLKNGSPFSSNGSRSGAAVVSNDTYFRGVVWPWRRKLPPDPAFGYFIAQPITLPVYCGLRMVDELGHVNNAKYLEITEFARWHQLAFLGLETIMMERKIAFVVSDLSITYQREIAPCSKVWVRTRFLLPPEAALMKNNNDATAPAGQSQQPQHHAVTDKKRFFVEHEIWSADGQKLHAALTLAAALIGPVSYEKELQQRYDSPAAPTSANSSKSNTKTPPRPRATLNCEQVLADVAGFASTAEVRKLFESVEHVCIPIADAESVTGDLGAAGATSVSAAVPQSKSDDDNERAERIQSLAHVWKTSRNVLRRKSLMAKSTKSKQH